MTRGTIALNLYIAIGMVILSTGFLTFHALLNKLQGDPERFMKHGHHPEQIKHLDILVPASGHDERLLAFAENLGQAIQDLSDGGDHDPQTLDWSFRLLVTRFPQDGPQSPEDLSRLKNKLSRHAFCPVEIVQTLDGTFSRSRARNVLHARACRQRDCLVAAIDLDVDLSADFFYHARDAVQPGISVYFPIVWSEYNPQSVQLVESYFRHHGDLSGLPANDNGNHALAEFSEHRGYWRESGKGIYVMSGVDAAHLLFDESFEGWGGEDQDFYDLLCANRLVSRRHDPGLVHRWHSKQCSMGIDVQTEKQRIYCLSSVKRNEGSTLGQQLLSEKKKEI